MNKLICGGFVGVLLAVSTLAQAQDVAPDALAKKVTEEVIAIIKTDKDIQSGNTRKVLDLVEAKVLPHFDFTRMTRLAVGAPWRQATSAQQQSLTNEFRTLLVHTYTSAFSQYRDQVIEYRPHKLQPADSEVIVRSMIKQKNGADPIGVNYSMEKTEQGWKVYDMTFDGISYLKSFRDHFREEIEQRGLDHLIARLEIEQGSA